MRMTILCVTLYLMAAVAANLFVAKVGQAGLLLTGFLLIPFDLVTRDVLHERWSDQRYLWVKMAGLILAGGLLSFLASDAARRVGFASAVSFLIAGGVDASVYQIVGNLSTSKAARMNGSNLMAALVDSFVFPLLAFGAVSAWLCYAQAIIKFAGGVMWTFLWLRYVRRNNGRGHVST